jgi:hypothetical protein
MTDDISDHIRERAETDRQLRARFDRHLADGLTLDEAKGELMADDWAREALLRFFVLNEVIERAKQ